MNGMFSAILYVGIIMLNEWYVFYFIICRYNYAQ